VIQNLSMMAFSYVELWFFKVVKVDVCGSLVLSNPVTYRYTVAMHVCIAYRPTKNISKFFIQHAGLYITVTVLCIIATTIIMCEDHLRSFNQTSELVAPKSECFLESINLRIYEQCKICALILN